MMPLNMCRPGETNTIKHIGGKEETRKFLNSLGFVEGCPVTVVSEISGNIIVSIKESRVAIDRSMAGHIGV
jgi:ferrous iron transport protein A